MARSTATAQSLSHGLAPTFTSIVAADDSQFLWESDVFLILKNTTGGSLVVTVKVDETVDGLTVPDMTITVGANSTKYTKSFPKDLFRQADGYVYVNTAADGIDMAVIRPQ